MRALGGRGGGTVASAARPGCAVCISRCIWLVAERRNTTGNVLGGIKPVRGCGARTLRHMPGCSCTQYKKGVLVQLKGVHC